MRALLVPLGLSFLFGCGTPTAGEAEPTARLELVAESTRRWTGLTMTPDGRLFVNFPRWSDDVPISVGEVVDGRVVPFPDPSWNAWKPGRAPGAHFVCVQSVVHDGVDGLWVLDPANPRFEGVVAGGPKLVRFDVATGQPDRVYRYRWPVVKERSYLNDVRIDRERGVAYVTDSGDGALIVTDLRSGTSRRLLDDHHATEADDVPLTIGSRRWRRPDGSAPRVHADGIALSPDGGTLYFQPLTGRALFSVPTRALRDADLSSEALGSTVREVARSGASDGLLCDDQGRVYVSALEHDAIRRVDPETGSFETVISSPLISWPDTFTRDPQGRVLFTTAQIHRGDEVPVPFRIFRILEEAR